MPICIFVENWLEKTLFDPNQYLRGVYGSQESLAYRNMPFNDDVFQAFEVLHCENFLFLLS